MLTSFCVGTGREWFTLPLLIAIEVYLKLNAYAKNLPSGYQLAEDFELFEAELFNVCIGRILKI